MKTILGLLLIVGGVLLALYVGIWLCFVGGIIAVIEQIRAEHLDSGAVAWGIARIIFAGVFGWLTGILVVVPGIALLGKD